jgi:hypothetical protein
VKPNGNKEDQMPRYVVTLALTLAPPETPQAGHPEDRLAQDFAAEVVREAGEHLMDGEKVELLAVEPATGQEV